MAVLETADKTSGIWRSLENAAADDGPDECPVPSRDDGTGKRTFSLVASRAVFGSRRTTFICLAGWADAPADITPKGRSVRATSHGFVPRYGQGTIGAGRTKAFRPFLMR